MDDLLKSANRLFLAMSLRGMQQLEELLTPTTRDGEQPATEAGRAPRHIHEGLIEDTARELYHLLLRASGFACETMSPLRGGDGITPRAAMNALIVLARKSAEIAEPLALNDDQKIFLRELQNKLFSFYQFEHIDSVLGISGPDEPVLTDLLDRIEQLGSFRAVWATEGLGHYYSDWHFSRGLLPQQLLSGAADPQFPKHRLVPLYAGLGLSLAESLLDSAEKNQFDLNVAVSRMAEFCIEHVHPGFRDEVFEGLGLATRNLYPHLISAIDHQLSQADEELLAYFWHGVGRAIYFSPTNFMPFRNAPWAGVEMCLREPPHALGQKNALAGWVWALTLVNLRSPEVMTTFLKHHAQDAAGDSFFNGVCSAAVIWQDSDPLGDALREFQSHEPAGAGPAGLWHDQVARACSDALHYHEVVRTRGALGKLFRYRELGTFFSNLAAGKENS